MDQELFAVFKAKAMAYDCLLEEGCFAFPDRPDDWLVRVKDPAKFAHRAAVAYIMQERYKNRNNIYRVR